MYYCKLGPDALGRIVEQPVVDGKVIMMPHRTVDKARRVRRAKRARRPDNVIMFSRPEDTRDSGPLG